MQTGVPEHKAPDSKGRVLRLYIAGTSVVSRRAQQNLAQLQRLIGAEWELQVIDVLVQPELAAQALILATPTLTYEHPERPRRVIGDLSATRKVLELLGIDMEENSGGL